LKFTAWQTNEPYTEGFYGDQRTLHGGRWSVAVSSPPAVEPITRDQAKANARVEHTDLDTDFDAWIVAARQHAEHVLRRALITQTIKLRLDQFPRGRRIELPAPPLQSVTSITYLDRDGATQTLSANNYDVDPYGLVGSIVLKENLAWPATESGVPNAVTIEYTAGYGDAADDVPQEIRTGLLYLTNHFYSQPDMVVTGSIATSVQNTFEALMTPYRVPQAF